MHGTFVVIAFATLTHLTASTCFKFYITRDLNNVKELPEEKWTCVEINPTESNVTVTFNISAALSASDAIIFFANKNKSILRVELNEYVQGKFYATPHKLVKEMKGEKTTKINDDMFPCVSGSFPQEWLPEKWNKVSAAVVGDGGQYYNYYKIQNFKISLPDLYFGLNTTDRPLIFRSFLVLLAFTGFVFSFLPALFQFRLSYAWDYDLMLI